MRGFIKYELNIIRRKYIILLSWLFTIACSTQSSSDKNDHRAHVQRIVTIADSLINNGPAWTHHFIDSAFGSILDASSFDMARKYDYLANYYYDRQKDFTKAGVYADSVLHVLADNTYIPEHAKVYAWALLIKGDALKSTSRYHDAIPYYYRGRQLLLETKDTCSFNRYSSRLAMLYYDLSKFRDAIVYFRESFDAMLHCVQDPYIRFAEQQAQLDNIALCYSSMNQYDSALYYYDSALHYIDLHRQQYLNNPNDKNRKNFIETAVGVINSNKGQTLLEMGDSSASEQLFRESIRMNRQEGHDLADAQNTMGGLASLLSGQHRYDEARDQLKQLRQSLDRSPNINAEFEYRKALWKYYDALNQTKPALASLKNFRQLKDSLVNTLIPLQPIDIQNQFNDISQHYELALLKKQSELKTLYLSIALVVVVMILLIIVQVLKTAGKSKRHIAELSKLNTFITEQHIHLKESLSALEQSQQENARMVRIVAHDLRNPVGGMVAMTEYLEDQDRLTEQNSREPLKLMKEAGTRAMNLINELLRLNVSDDMTKEPVELDITLKYCVDMLRLKTNEKGQRITLHLIPAMVLANREKLWRVFSNLITNAVKFSPAGSTIAITMQNEGGSFLISIKDQGIGIPASFRGKIFNLSPEIKRMGTSGERSFGLGLVIVKQIVEAHDGSIWYESKEGEGSVFYVRLKNAPITMVQQKENA